MKKEATVPHVDPDRDLVLACQDALRAGRTPPFEELCQRHYERVFRQCLRVLGNESDARDACQESFQCVLRRIASFQFRSLFTTWLHNVTFNCCRDLARSRQYRMRGGVAEDLTSVSCRVDDDPASQFSRHELEALVEHSIAGLSPTLRSVVVPRYFAQCSYEDIARRLGITLGTVKSRLFRAHEILRDTLAGRLDVEEMPAGCELN